MNLRERMDQGVRPPRMRVGVVCDYPEEGWPSMDLTAAMILEGLAQGHADEVAAERICPTYRRRLGGNVDRLANRLFDYPRALRRRHRGAPCDLYHLVDHSYAQLIHVLPADRVVVTCHDLDTFRCLLEPHEEPRPWWFRRMAGHILAGFRKAGAVACVSEATRQEILRRGLVSADRLHVVPQGTRPEFSAEPDAEADAAALALLGPPGPVDLLHVGSTIPRKRIDVLLDVFASVRRSRPEARLIKVGAAFNAEQEAQARALGVLDAIVRVPPFPGDSTRDWSTLAAIYRRASLVLQPSEAEGFGLPVAEAMACGAPLVVSDLPVLREVAGVAAVYCPVGDVAAWTGAVLGAVEDREGVSARRAIGLERARRFSWAGHVEGLVSLYRRVLGAAG